MNVSLPWITTLFFVTIRLGTVLLFTPIQALKQLPVRVRLLFIFILSMLLVTNIPYTKINSDAGLFIGGISECAQGLILSASLYAAFSIFHIAGQLIDNQTGLNSIALFNPGEHTQESLTSCLLTMLSVLLFFGLDGHLLLFKGLAYSFTVAPPGSILLFAGFTPVIKQFGFMFTMAFMIASPIVLSLLIIDLAGAILTRNMPQVSTYFLTIAFKIMFGLFLLNLSLSHMNPITKTVFDRSFQTWQELMS